MAQASGNLDLNRTILLARADRHGLNQIPDRVDRIAIALCNALAQSRLEPVELAGIVLQNSRVQRDHVFGRLRERLQLGLERAALAPQFFGPAIDISHVAVARDDRIRGPADGAVDFEKTPLDLMPSLARRLHTSLARRVEFSDDFSQHFRMHQFGPQAFDDHALDRVETEGARIRARAALYGRRAADALAAELVAPVDRHAPAAGGTAQEAG